MDKKRNIAEFRMETNKIVLIVHAVDTEGPLYESLDAKFERLNDFFKINHLDRTWKNIRKLQKGEIDLGGAEKKIVEVLSGHLTSFKETWDQIDEMLERINKPSFRNEVTDSFGEGWKFNWHCLDHVGFEYNPRRRDIGYHNIFDHYRAMLKNHPDLKDGIHWHFHPTSAFKDAHRCATSYENSRHLHQVLSRRILERGWFPAVFRAGFQAERPDSHWFLEQYIPFDISNMALDDNSELEATIDFKNGRSGDWRLAPSDWSVYNPSHDNYQLKGNCRRHIGRALNVLNRLASIDEREMDKAFARANAGLPALVGLASHDFRDLETEVRFLRSLIAASSKKFPEVQFKFCEAVEAFRLAIWKGDIPNERLKLEMNFFKAADSDVPRLEIHTIAGKVFGPQPYLAIETKARQFIHDNLDFDKNPNRWHYAFHNDSIPIEHVRRVGIAANDKYGNQEIKVIEFD